MFSTVALVEGRLRPVVMEEAPVFGQPKGTIRGRSVHYRRMYLHPDGSIMAPRCESPCAYCPISRNACRDERLTCGCRHVYEKGKKCRSVWVAFFDDPDQEDSLEEADAYQEMDEVSQACFV